VLLKIQFHKISIEYIIFYAYTVTLRTPIYSTHTIDWHGITRGFGGGGYGVQHHENTEVSFSLNIFYLLKCAKRIRHKLNKLMKSSPMYNKLQHYLIEHACI
jgi:hypothetical protein